ncbi:DNA replication protein DnaC [Lutibacter agarilyticus]|uniref:DNA replication protein DnaC n=1 Tax=Lutibacter agarilyticus TaxID=1109740 RepID=A0A238X5W5_9FLAO|nr:ATPase [Lutibacter agarilyticus]SNR54426.1 DNA replication protein DnaC [Lutibacter agarilyticus]
MNSTPHIKTEGTSKFQIGEIRNNTVHYDFEKIKTYLNIKGHMLFGKNFRIYKEDEAPLFKLCSYFIQDHHSCAQMGIDTSKGILLSGPVGCGKTSLMQLLLHLAPHKTTYEIIPTRNIVFSFNASGFETLEQYNQTRNYCFDDLGVEPTGSHYAKDCNVMGEILLSRYNLSCHPKDVIQSLSKYGTGSYHTKFRVTTHITTNLNAQELEKRYGNRVRSCIRAMFNLISFDEASVDKRK